MFGEALREAEKYKDTCERNGWPVRSGYTDISSAVPEGTVAAKNNSGLYRKLENAIDEYVYSDLPQHTMVCMGQMAQVNKVTGKKRQMLILYDCENTRCLINPNAFGLNARVEKYSCFEVRYVSDGKSKRKVVSVKPTGRIDVLRYEPAAIIRLGEDGGIATVLGKDFKLQVSNSDIFIKGKIGQSVEVAFNRREVEGKVVFRCVDLRATDKPNDLLNEFQGTLRLVNKNGKAFGFVDGIYIGKHLLDGFSDGEFVSGISVSEDGRNYAITLSRCSSD